MILVIVKPCDKRQDGSAVARETLFVALSERFSLPRTEIKKTEAGKPYFEDERYPAFSISHTEGAICVAMSDSAESVGVDIEKYSDRLQNNRLTDRFFPSLTAGENEISDIALLTEADVCIEENTDIVFTLGEAIIKCDGGGFAIAQRASELSQNMKKASFKLTASSGAYALSIAIKERK